MFIHASEQRFQSLTNGNTHPNGWQCRMLVFSQSEARRFAVGLGTTHVLSIKGCRTRYLGPSEFHDDKHLLLTFNDIEDADGELPPTSKHITDMMDWMRKLPQEANLVIHCLQGVHRSCAAALGFLAFQTNPADAVCQLRAVRPQANPNRLMVALWDDWLDLNGTLIEAVNATVWDG